MKKIEGSLIKRLLRISEQDLVSLALELSHYSLSLILLDIEFSWSTLALEQEGKEGKRKQISTKER